MLMLLLLFCCVVTHALQYRMQQDAAGTVGWVLTEQSRDVDAGRLCQVVDALPARDRVDVSDGAVLTPQQLLLLVQLDSSTGPVVALPAVDSIVRVVHIGSIYEVRVQHMPVRIGWAMTVPAAQGMEFDRVVLDLTSADWLEGFMKRNVARFETRFKPF